MACYVSLINISQLVYEFLTIVDEATLRKRIAVLQNYRRMGITTVADGEKYDVDVVKRVRNGILHRSTSLKLFWG